jgi:nickel-type superoxide dismutase maturation protease
LAVFSLGLAVVSGRSMEPTLYDGDRLLVHYGATPRPGRVAVVRLPERPVAVKRLVSQLEDGWWVARDNPSMGVDSAQVGSIPEEDVLGCVVMRVWPLRGRGDRRGRTGTASGAGG